MKNIPNTKIKILDIKIPHINTLCINNISTLIAPIILEFIHYRLQIFLVSLLLPLAPFENNWKQFTNDQKKKERKKKTELVNDNLLD